MTRNRGVESIKSQRSKGVFCRFEYFPTDVLYEISGQSRQLYCNSQIHIWSVYSYIGKEGNIANIKKYSIISLFAWFLFLFGVEDLYNFNQWQSLHNIRAIFSEHLEHKLPFFTHSHYNNNYNYIIISPFFWYVICLNFCILSNLISFSINLLVSTLSVGFKQS